jgi:glutamate racemase
MELASEALPAHAGAVHEQFAAASTVFIACTHYTLIGLKVPGLLYESPCIILHRGNLVCSRKAEEKGI